MSMKNSQASFKTLLGRVLTALFYTNTKVTAEIPKIPRLTGFCGYGDAPAG